MIEATCAACGIVNRIAEADVPLGAKFVACSSCKSKVALPQRAAVPTPAGKPAAKPVAIPALPPKLPTPPKGVPTPSRNDTIDLADLPAPKRQSPLAGAQPASKPAPPSALSGAELPAPKSGAKPPAASPGALDLDDLMESPGLADLPAPKPRPSPLGDLPAPKPQKSALADLPAPKAKPSALSDLPAPKQPAAAPKPQAGAPKPQAAAPKPAGLTDLPTPKGPGGLTDLPAPKGPAGITDLPTPKKQQAARDVAALTLDDDLDLPMPKAGVTDLPMPKPGANNDLLAPKGFFDDLPQPAQGVKTQELAPKGFFDDLPQPAQGVKTQDLAPKGFFDDLPEPSKAKTQELAPKGAGTQALASKPQSQELTPKGAGSQGLAPKPPGSQELAPKGLFDDLPQPSAGGIFDDLPEPNAANRAMGAGDIDLGPVGGGPGLELDSKGPDLDLGMPLGESQQFQDLDLSEPTAKPVEDGSPIKIKTPRGGAPAKPIPITVPAKPATAADLKLDLADDPHGKPAAVAGTRITPKKKGVEVSPEVRAAKRKRTRIILAVFLLLAAAGAGGFYFYQKRVKEQERQAKIGEQIGIARKQIKSEQPKHWARAAGAAEAAIELDSKNVQARGLAAEASLAGAIDEGINYEARLKKGRNHISEALGSGRTGPEIERAQAVNAITQKGQAQRAVDLLKAQIAKDPKDGWLQLYMGWAQLEKGDAAEAIKAFDAAAASTPATKLPALYGHGKAKLLLADVAGARTAFESILQINKDHVCAQVGLTSTKSPSESVQQVAELEALLQRKDIAQADPRCVVAAHTLIGDVHRTAGRLDMARQRYRDGLKLVKNDVPTHNGLAAVELRDGKLAVAAEHIQTALAHSPENPDTLLLQSELQIKEGKLPDAEATIEKLAARQPPLPTLAQARLFVVKGRLLEAKGQDDAAVDAFTEGAKLAGDLDLTPTMAAVTKLSDLAKKATEPAKQTEYRGRADQLLQALDGRAKEDAQLSMAIGQAYLQAGDPVKAEGYLRRAVAMREKDPDGKLQLAKALDAQNKFDEAIKELSEALAIDGKRTDIALELAQTYQLANKHDQAIAAYEKLLALPEVPIIVRVNAGRYFARRGLLDKAAAPLIDKAAAQAEPILAAEPDNPGGLYLKGEGLLRAGKADEATPLLVRASDNDPEAQYLDALGRAYELRVEKSNDTKLVESARFAYERATKADPKMFHPWLGMGRVLCHPVKREWEQAVKALEQASKIDKDHSEVRYYMGVAYFGLRAKPETRKTGAGWLEAALKGTPELDLKRKAEASHMLGILYQDINSPRDTVRAYENSTKFGEDMEKQGLNTPTWLVEDYYQLGDTYRGLANCAGQKRAWQKYYDRNPPSGARKNDVGYALGTSLKGC